MDKVNSLQKKLFEDPPDPVNDDDILAICSGRFTDTQSSERPAHSTQHDPTDSQIMDLCSGEFFTQPVDMQKRLETTNSTTQLVDDTSQDITLTLDDDDDLAAGGDDDNPKNTSGSPGKTVSSVKRSDESMFSSDSKSPVKVDSGFKNPMDAWLRRGNDGPTPAATQRPDRVTDSQIMDICSGSFDSQPVDIHAGGGNETPSDGKSATPEIPEVTDSQILDVCSGAFGSLPVDMMAPEGSARDQTGKSATTQTQERRDEVTDSQIMDVCSGAFGTLPVDMQALEGNARDDRAGKSGTMETQEKRDEVTDSQIMDICSGAFSSQPIDLKALEKKDMPRIRDEESRDFRLTLDDHSEQLNQKVSHESQNGEIHPELC